MKKGVEFIQVETEQWHTFNSSDVIKAFKSSEKGIIEEEVKKRLEHYGLNELKKIKKVSPVKIFFSQFASFFVYILIFAAILTIILSEWIDFYVIIAVILINASLGFFQQYKAEKGIEKLRKIFQQTAKVIRNGSMIKIDHTEVVPGDILYFEAGDKIVVDSRIISCENLQVSEAVLTGESMPSHKIPETIKDSVALADRINMVYAGTTVATGYGKAVVVATGMHTEFGKIAMNIQEIVAPPTPLQKKLELFTKKLGIVILGACLLFLIIGFAFKLDQIEILLTAITLAVAAVPEGLPIVITISLALTVQRMLKVNTLIRKLPAAEGLGAVTVICSDKTGTITAEEMQVTKIFCNNTFFDVKAREIKDGIEKIEYEFFKDKKIIEPVEEKELMKILTIGILCNNARFEKKDDTEYVLGDPTEKALLLSAMGAGLNKAAMTHENKRVKEFSFTSKRKMMSIIREKDGMTSYVKGSPEIVLERCNKELRMGREVLLSSQRKKDLQKKYELMAASALRVLAFAYKKVKKTDIDEAENSLVFVGFQGIFDSPRPEVKDAIRICKEAGIQVKMLTGDNAITAKAVAEMIDLHGDIITGHELKLMNDSKLAEKIERTTIFARIDPEDKLRIVTLLRKKGEIVAVTGDGVNDAPALKQADIGIAMGIRGADVTRDVAEIILLDDNFSSIEKSIEEGRRIEDNIKNAISFMVSLNFVELLVISVSLIIGLPLPLLPLQILLVNIITDSIPSLAIGVEKADKDIMKSKPRNVKQGLLRDRLPVLTAILIFSTLILILIFVHFLYVTDITRARTVIVTTLIMLQMFLVLGFRSSRTLWEIGLFSNKPLIYSVIVAIGIHLILVYTSLNKLFNLVPLTLYDWIFIIPISLSGLVGFEVYKHIKRRKK
ncbi:HAD-IC family P-type ATPase [Candidatus Pacearchaeota archaeon]|nr:HAD-IC family P-type ATPase [Candidatus Pacearchaeota archaeon]